MILYIKIVIDEVFEINVPMSMNPIPDPIGIRVAEPLMDATVNF
jgi:hypothetical protein